MRPFRLNQIKGAKEIVKVQGFKKFFKRGYRRYSAGPDFEIKNAIKRYSNDYEVFIDIGAAVGSITFSVATSFSRCICFEPEERNYRDFLNKLKNLGFSNIQIFNYALGKEKGKKKFFVSETARLDNRFNIEDNEKFKEYEVEVDTLDNTCTKLGINEKCVIKIDVQGGEIDRPDFVMVSRDQEVFDEWMNFKGSLTNAIIAERLWISLNREFITVFKLDRLPRSIRRTGGVED